MQHLNIYFKPDLCIFTTSIKHISAIIRVARGTSRLGGANFEIFKNIKGGEGKTH